MSTGLVPIETLGAAIKARVEAGDKALDKAEQHYISAGIQLAEAKKRLAETGEMLWSAFLFSHARVRRRRAADLMAIADGRTTLADLREKNRERVAAHRERKKTEVALRNAEPVAITASVPDARPAEYLRAIIDRQDKEIERLKGENAKLRHLVMHGGSREGLLDEDGDDIGGDVFVISACESADMTCMQIEPFWPLDRDDTGKLKTFLGLNRAEWRVAPEALIRFARMREAVDLWNVEYDRDIGNRDLGWPEDSFDCLQQRYRRAGIASADQAAA